MNFLLRSNYSNVLGILLVQFASVLFLISTLKFLHSIHFVYLNSVFTQFSIFSLIFLFLIIKVSLDLSALLFAFNIRLFYYLLILGCFTMNSVSATCRVLPIYVFELHHLHFVTTGYICSSHSPIFRFAFVTEISFC